MNRTEFMRQLEALLQNISQAEREEALQYYNDYFDDAGSENEQDVIEALGNPARVAENIKRDLYSNGYGDSGYHQSIPDDKAVIPYNDGSKQQGYYSETTGSGNADAVHTANQEKTKNSEKMSPGMIALIVVLCILASPLLVGLLSGVVGTLIGLISAWFGLIIGFGATALALIVVFITLAGVGIAALLTEPLVGVALIGGGMLCGGIGILFMMLTVAMAGIATPAMCKGTITLFKKLFHK